MSGFSTPIHALPAVTKEASPWIRWLNRDELARLADLTIGARVPHRGPDTVQSFGNRSGAAVHTAGRHHRSVKLLGNATAKCDARVARDHWNGWRTERFDAAGAALPPCNGHARHAITSACAWSGSAPPEPRWNWPDCSVACRWCCPRQASQEASCPDIGFARNWSSPRPARSRGARGESGTMRIPCRGPSSTRGPVCMRPASTPMWTR